MSNATQQDRITSDPAWPFLACKDLPVRQEMLSREGMAGISGEGFVVPFLLGVAANAAWYYRKEIYDGVCSAADYCGDAVSQWYDVMTMTDRKWRWED